MGSLPISPGPRTVVPHLFTTENLFSFIHHEVQHEQRVKSPVLIPWRSLGSLADPLEITAKGEEEEGGLYLTVMGLP